MPLPDVASLLWAIREGSVLPDTPLAVDDEKHFQKASLVTAYQQAAVAANRSGPRPSASTAAAIPWHSKKSVRIALIAAAVVVVAVTVSLRIQSLGRQHAQEFATKPVGPAPAFQSALGRIEAEFGDSAAVAQRRLQEWVAGRRFDEKLRGGSLRNPGSLRQVRATVDLYQAEIDSLLARTRTLAVSMVRRADSMEGGGGTLDGLSVSVEDALVDWQRELVVYAGLEHNTAATIDSLAGFVLGRQQSFVIREGQPVFLSRADAARFRELTANLGTLAGREKNWAGALLGRRPAWMSALAESARPQFGRNILSDRASN